MSKIHHNSKNYSSLTNIQMVLLLSQNYTVLEARGNFHKIMKYKIGEWAFIQIIRK